MVKRVMTDREEFMTYVRDREDTGEFIIARDIDLNELDFRGYDLSYIVFNHVCLTRANMHGVELCHSIFVDTDMFGAVLSRANMMDTVIHDSDFRFSCLEGARLDRAIISQANFNHAKARDISLARADIRSSSFHSACLQYAGCKYTVFQDCALTNADLYRINLAGAELISANLDLSGFPLWCGGLDVKIDDKIACQLLYHLIRCIQNNEHISPDISRALQTEELIRIANRFHRVFECGELECGDMK